MSMHRIISFLTVRSRCVWIRNSLGKSVADPLQAPALAAHHIETAGRLASAEMKRGERWQEIPGGSQQALLLAAVYTGGSPAMARRSTKAHFDEDQRFTVA